MDHTSEYAIPAGIGPLFYQSFFYKYSTSLRSLKSKLSSIKKLYQ
jgi:hypothetical protein